MKNDKNEAYNALIATETRQYACACLLIFTSEHMRGIPYLFDMTISCLPELLPKDDSLTQFYSVTGNYLSLATFSPPAYMIDNV